MVPSEPWVTMRVLAPNLLYIGRHVMNFRPKVQHPPPPTHTQHTWINRIDPLSWYELCWAVLSYSVMSNSLRPHGPQSPPGSSVHGTEARHWSGLPCPPPGDLPNPGVEPRSPALRADSLPSAWLRRVQAGFPGGWVVKNPPPNAGAAGSIPRLGRSPGGGNRNPLQYL